MRIQRAFPSLIPIGCGRASPLREHDGPFDPILFPPGIAERAAGRSGSVYTMGFSAD